MANVDWSGTDDICNRKGERLFQWTNSKKRSAPIPMTHPKPFSLFRLKIEDPFPRRVGESAFRLSVTLNESV